MHKELRLGNEIKLRKDIDVAAILLVAELLV